MITLSITYRHTEGAPFDWDYYISKHLPMAGETYKPFELTLS